MEIRPYILSDINWKIVKETSYDVAILPWGATEAHNYHLPYGTDIIEAESIAAASAKIAWEQGAKIIVLPVIPFGVNTGQYDVKLDMNMYPTTQLAVLRDVVEVLDRHGIHKLIILNSHGGNDFKTMIRELGLKFPSMFLCQCNWFQAVDQKDFFEHKDDHAGEMETSVMMHLTPQLSDRCPKQVMAQQRNFGSLLFVKAGLGQSANGHKYRKTQASVILVRHLPTRVKNILRL
jgi:creatinine amidohydrolase